MTTPTRFLLALLLSAGAAIADRTISGSGFIVDGILPYGIKASEYRDAFSGNKTVVGSVAKSIALTGGREWDVSISVGANVSTSDDQVVQALGLGMRPSERARAGNDTFCFVLFDSIASKTADDIARRGSGECKGLVSDKCQRALNNLALFGECGDTGDVLDECDGELGDSAQGWGASIPPRDQFFAILTDPADMGSDQARNDYERIKKSGHVVVIQNGARRTANQTSQTDGVALCLNPTAKRETTNPGGDKNNNKGDDDENDKDDSGASSLVSGSMGMVVLVTVLASVGVFM